MEREDPLEKLERKQADQKANGGLRALMIAMIVVALGLAAALAYVLSSKNKLVNDLNQEKQDLTEQIVALQSDYENLSSEYDTINAQLDSSREEIAQLVDRVKRTEATDRAKIRQYEKELGTLRSIMRGYITQIDSLNTLNHRLTEEAASARKEAEETKEINTRLTQQVEDLTGRVTAGSVLKAHNFVMYAYNNADKITDKANRVVRFLVNLSLVENELAERGPVRVYVRVTDPDGNLLSDGPRPSPSAARPSRPRHPVRWTTRARKWTWASTSTTSRPSARASTPSTPTRNRRSSATANSCSARGWSTSTSRSAGVSAPIVISTRKSPARAGTRNHSKLIRKRSAPRSPEGRGIPAQSAIRTPCISEAAPPPSWIRRTCAGLSAPCG